MGRKASGLVNVPNGGRRRERDACEDKGQVGQRARGAGGRHRGANRRGRLSHELVVLRRELDDVLQVQLEIREPAGRTCAAGPMGGGREGRASGGGSPPSLSLVFLLRDSGPGFHPNPAFSRSSSECPEVPLPASSVATRARPREPSPRSPNFAHRAPRCATRDYLRALAPPPGEGRLSSPDRDARSAIIFAPLGVT